MLRWGLVALALATNLNSHPALPGVGGSGEFDLDCDRLAVLPLETVQAIGKIFERSVLREQLMIQTDLAGGSSVGGIGGFCPSDCQPRTIVSTWIDAPVKPGKAWLDNK
jgi:hypothetical protein